MVALIVAMCYANGMMCGRQTVIGVFPSIMECSAGLEIVKAAPNYVTLQKAKNGGALKAYCQLSTPQWDN